MILFDEFPSERHLRTPAEQERFSLNVLLSDLAVDMFDDIEFKNGLATLLRHGEIVGQVQISIIPKLGGTC